MCNVRNIKNKQIKHLKNCCCFQRFGGVQGFGGNEIGVVTVGVVVAVVVVCGGVVGGCGVVVVLVWWL